jgi:hypothetical protein
MAEPRQCKECNGTFLYTTNDNLCFSCSQKNEMEFQRIKEYLKQFPKSSIGTVSTSLNITVACIQRFIDEGRLEMVENTISAE